MDRGSFARLSSGFIATGWFALSVAAAAAPLQTFTVKDYLQHQWTDELVHFDIDYPGDMPSALTLTDAEGKPVPCQMSGVARNNGRVTGRVWTVVTLPPDGTATLDLVPGHSAPTALRLQVQGNEFVLGNEYLTLRLPRLTGALREPIGLAALPAPVLAIGDPGGKHWLGHGSWVNADPPLQAKTATSTVIEEGPVRVTVRYKLVFTDNRFYQADLTLGARQDCALFADDTDLDVPNAAFHFSFQAGLGADRLYWRNNFYGDPSKGLTPGPIRFDPEQVICRLRPWSFWWVKDLANWAGFFKDGAEPFLGVLAVRPSRWTPSQLPGLDGFERTQVPVTARPGGQLDIVLGLLAATGKRSDGTAQLYPLHRELAFTLGTVGEHVTKDETRAKLRRQLLKYSEFPLDEVLRYGFDFTAANRRHPCLLFTEQDIARVRRQYRELPEVKAIVDKALGALQNERVDDTLRAKGWEEFFTRHYHHNADNWVLAYLGSDDPRYGQYLAAATRGLRKYLLDTWVEHPVRPSVGGVGPWGTGHISCLAMYDDLLAGRGLLTPQEESQVRATNVFFAHVLAHPDYWNQAVGLMSGNPNMTSVIRLSQGVEGLLLAGHPQADRWLAKAEEELQSELKDWISPGGAWIECPGYQAATLDGMFFLAQMLKQVKGRDYFADPNFKATMEYYGQILTPPDPRYPTWRKPEEPPWSTLPTIGDTPAGQVACYNGWMALATARQDPDYSARQQFYWKAQGGSFIRAGRSAGFILALTDYALPTKPPTALAAAFPGFGSVLRTSWTDPRAAYVVHRTGPDLHHYHDDFNTIIFAAKGSPLAGDFGNQYAPLRREESWYHNRVSFSKSGQPTVGSTGRLVDTVFLPRTVDYSYGLSTGSGNQENHRHVLLISSADPLGANYVVVRDRTVDGQPNQKFYWNLFCLAKQPQVQRGVVHFPGPFGVDLDVHLLCPAGAPLEQDRWSWKYNMAYWGDFGEEMFGVRVEKTGSAQDFLAVLYPRAAGQGPAEVSLLADGRGAEMAHPEGKDVVLLSPGTAAAVTSGTVRLAAEIAMARVGTNGSLRLAVVKGASATAAVGPWALSSSGPVAVHIQGTVAEGESHGEAHEARLTLPPASRPATVALDGQPVAAQREKDLLIISLPAGNHVFTVSTK